MKRRILARISNAVWIFWLQSCQCWDRNDEMCDASIKRLPVLISWMWNTNPSSFKPTSSFLCHSACPTFISLYFVIKVYFYQCQRYGWFSCLFAVNENQCCLLVLPKSCSLLEFLRRYFKNSRIINKWGLKSIKWNSIMILNNIMWCNSIFSGLWERIQ